MTVLATIEELRQRPGEGETIPIIDPVTEQSIAEYSDGGPAAIDRAVARARETFDSGIWHQMPQSEQAQVLWRVAELLEAQADDMAQLDSLNTGMPLPQARRNIAAAIEFFRYFSGWCTKINGIAHDVRMTGGLSGLDGSVHAYTIKEPVGVVGLIIPWIGDIVEIVLFNAPLSTTDRHFIENYLLQRYGI